MKSKYETVITRQNGGNHCPKATKQSWEWLDACIAAYKYPRLYHLVITAHKDLATFAGYKGYETNKAILKDVMQRLRRKGIRASYRACREVNDHEKGDHVHAFICCESGEKNPDKVLTDSRNGWLQKYANLAGANVWLSAPQDSIHDGFDYMKLTPPKHNEEGESLTPADEDKTRRIADAKIWVSYLQKRRTKPDCGEVYSCSRTI